MKSLSFRQENRRVFITKTSIPRRTMLRGLGAMLALPFLDRMVPALSALGTPAAKPINRYGFPMVRSS